MPCGSSGGDGDLSQTAVRSMQKPINIFGNRIFQAFRIMRTFARQRKERTFQMRSKNVRASTHHATHGLKIGAHHVERVGDQTEHLTGGAVHHMTCAGHAYALHTVIEGTPPRTVRMNVDVTGSHHAACSVTKPAEPVMESPEPTELTESESASASKPTLAHAAAKSSSRFPVAIIALPSETSQ